uniref:SCP domain-containing protein n=1 Tax=Zooxanthella nutricula TaxID=1333877 RepID=A0A7S2KUU4_9DINO
MRAVAPCAALLASWACTAAASAAEPAACARESPGACAQPPILIQTHQAVQRSSGPLPASVAPLVPPFVAPPGGSARIAAARQKAQAQARPAQPGRQSSSSASAADREGFNLMKQLRAAGFTCPGGTYFPPNDGEFEFDCRLWQASLGHSQDMGARNYFSHESPAPNPTDPFDRSAATGLATFSENIAAGEGSAEATLEQWKNSDGHCRNMMDPAHNRMGVAHALTEGSTYRHYWTQMFANDGGDADHSCLP